MHISINGITYIQSDFPSTTAPSVCLARQRHCTCVAVRLLLPKPSTLRTIFSPSSTHYPSPDRTGDLWTVFPTTRGRPACSYPRGYVCVLRSRAILSLCYDNDSFEEGNGTYVLVYEQDGYILSFFCEAVESLFYLRRLGLRIDDEEVALGRGRFGDMLLHKTSATPLFRVSEGIEGRIRQLQRGEARLQSP